MRILTTIAILLGTVAAASDRQTLASFPDVQPVLEAMKDRLPPPLASLSEAAWNSWSRSRSAEIRTRLEQGEVDSMINLLLFGTSFTKRPRIQLESLAEASRSGLLRGRVDDLLQGLRSPGGNERLLFLRDLIRRQGLDPDADDGKTGLFIYKNLKRVLEERAKFNERGSKFAKFGAWLGPGAPKIELTARLLLA